MTYKNLCISGERLSDFEVDELLTHIDLTEDLEGNVKYEGMQILLYSESSFSEIREPHSSVGY